MFDGLFQSVRAAFTVRATATRDIPLRAMRDVGRLLLLFMEI